ncbi:MAG TPA: VOC family protein [Blastocatellia bacterium]|jgi:predicted enzyme related to lactoylglutathione lyase
MPRVVHFEISADDPARAVKFYSDIFGWEIQKWDGPQDYWLVKTGEDGKPGINGGLFKRQGPMTGHINTVEVDDLDGLVSKVIASGGKVVVEKFLIPGIGWLVYCKDTEESIFGMLQPDASAK